MPTTIKVVEDDDTFFFGPNAVLFIQHGDQQIQITFNDEGGANIVQFEPHGGSIYAELDGAYADYFTKRVQVSQ